MQICVERWLEMTGSVIEVWPLRCGKEERGFEKGREQIQFWETGWSGSA